MAEAPLWLRFLFGLDSGEIPAGADARLELTGLWRGGAGWLAVLLIGLSVTLIVLLYRRERELGLLQRSTLTLLRLAALGLIVWMLLDPRLLTEIQIRRPATTFLLVDGSASMFTQDEFEDPDRRPLEEATGLDLRQPATRVSLLTAAVERNHILEGLSEKNRLKLLAFDAGTRGLETLDAAALPPPGGRETRLGDALETALRAAGQEPVAALVVISDGRSNAGAAVTKAVAEAAGKGVPIHTVLVGKTKEPQNGAVVAFSGPDVAVPGFPLRLEGRIEVSGLRGPLQATLYRQKLKGGAKEKVEEKTIQGRSAAYSSTIVFVDTPLEKGTFRYTLTLEPQAEETETADNEKTLQVTVADEKCRILLLAGSPTIEFRELKKFLIRDDGLQVSCWLATADPGSTQEGDVVIRELPRTRDQFRPYDVVVLLDPDPRTLTDAFLEILKQFVLEDGGGLAYAAGEYFTEDLWAQERLAPLRAILPVESGPRGPRRPNRALTKPWRPSLTRAGAEHPVCRLSDDPHENAEVWAKLPPLFFNAGGTTLKPAAACLLQRENGEVIAAVEKAGAGSSFFLGFDDSFFRWKAWREAIPQRFWASILRYLALGKKLAGTGDVALTSDRDRYSAGEEVSFEASLTDSERKPVEKERVEVAIEAATDPGARSAAGDREPPKDGAPPSTSGPTVESTRLNLLPIAGRPGWYAGRYRPGAPGRYTAQILGVDDPKAGKVAFSVIAATSEWEDPSPDPDALAEISSRTGGVALPLAAIRRLPELVGDRSVTEVVGRSASTVWDSSAIMLLFALLLTAEWALRKLWRLN
jgi:hypothetical protein